MGIRGTARFRTRTAGLLAAFVILTLTFAACGGSGGSGSSGTESETPGHGGTLQVGLGAEAEVFDPSTALDGSSIQVLQQMIEPLFFPGPDGTPQPALATSVKPSEDQRVWTVQLRPNVKFSNGQPVTSADVVFSLDRVRKSSGWGFLFEQIEDVKASGPDTVLIEAKEPLPAMETLLSVFASGIIPKDFGGLSEEEFAQEPIGSGPFMMGTWKRGQSITLNANPHYWKSQLPYLDHLVFFSTSDTNSRVEQLRGGRFDVIESPGSSLQSLEQSPDLRVGEYSLALVTQLVLNVRKDLFKDPRVREAASLAIDREGIVKVALSGRGAVAGSWFPPQVRYRNASIKQERNVAKAKELLAEAVKDGAEPSFSILYQAGESYFISACAILQQDFEEVGFKVKLQPLDESAEISQLVEGSYDAIDIGFIPNIIDPSDAVSFYTSNKAFFSGGETAELEALGRKAAIEIDSAKRQAMYEEIQEIINQDKNILPIDYHPFVWVMQKDVAGMNSNTTGTVKFGEVGFAE